MDKVKNPHYLSVQDLGDSLLYVVDYGKGAEEIRAFRDLALNTLPLTDQMKERIALRNLPLMSEASYVFKLHGGLGDVLIGLQTVKSFRRYMTSLGHNPEIVAILSEKDIRVLGLLLKAQNIFHQILSLESLEQNNSDFRFRPIILNAGPEPVRPESLGLGSYHNALWASWGLPGQFDECPLDESDFKYISDAKLKFQDYLSRHFPNLRSERTVLFFPVGFGLMNRWKMWSEDNWIKLVEKLQASEDVDILVSTDRPELLPLLQKNKKIGWINHLITPDFDFECLVGAIAQSALSISIDTGPAHLAPLVGRKAMVLFGPTNPLIYGQPGNDNIRLSPCYPCYFSSQTLLCGDNVCMKDNDVETVSALAKKRLHEWLLSST
jgi:hypothetical protein